MKKITFVFCFALLSLQKTDAQTGREKLKESTFNSDNFQPYLVEIKSDVINTKRIKNLKSVQFIDVRADTSKLGFIRIGEHNDFHRLICPDVTTSYVSAKINKKLNNAGGGNILFVIHSLWLSQVIKPGSLASKVLVPGGFGAMKYFSYCYIDVDCYTNTDVGFKYLGRIDSIISSAKWIGNVADNIFSNSINNIIVYADSLYANSKLDTYLVTYNQIIENEKADYNYPILKASQPQKGIYLTYQDFLNNSPNKATFNITNDKERIIQTGSLDTSITNKAWGYCDSINVYKHINKNFYKMNRVGNTFELVGPRMITQLYSKEESLIAGTASVFLGIVAGGLGSAFGAADEKIMKELVPYQLNIKEGTLY